MKKLLIKITFFIFVLGTPNTWAINKKDGQNKVSHTIEVTIPALAVIDLYSTNGATATINLYPDVNGLEAGSAIDFSTATDNSLWLNYSSLIAENQSLRNITVNVTGDALPEGISLQLTASPANANNKGNGKGNDNLNGSGNGNGSKSENGTGSESGNENGNSKGGLGNPVNEPIVLSTTSQNIITGIGSGYTGSGEDGHRLTYSLTMDNTYYSTLFAKDYNLLVTYTITGE